jgi:hypothetical protein
MAKVKRDIEMRVLQVAETAELEKEELRVEYEQRIEHERNKY